MLLETEPQNLRGPTVQRPTYKGGSRNSASRIHICGPRKTWPHPPGSYLMLCHGATEHLSRGRLWDTGQGAELCWASAFSPRRWAIISWGKQQRPRPHDHPSPPQLPTFMGSMLNFLRPMHSSFSFWAIRLQTRRCQPGPPQDPRASPPHPQSPKMLSSATANIP